jgi:hypothetical protein
MSYAETKYWLCMKHWLSIIRCALVDDYVAYYLPFGYRRHDLVRLFTTLTKLLKGYTLLYKHDFFDLVLADGSNHYLVLFRRNLRKACLNHPY